MTTQVGPKEGDTEDRSKYYQGIKFYDPTIVGLSPEAVRLTSDTPPVGATSRDCSRAERDANPTLARNSTPSPGGMFGSAGVPTRPAGYTGAGSRADSGTPPAASRQLHSRTHSHAQLGIPETAHGPALDYHQLPHGSSTHALTHTPSWVYRRRLTGRLWNTASCLTASPLTHSHAQLGIPETAHGPALEYRQLPHGGSTHALTSLTSTSRWSTRACATCCAWRRRRWAWRRASCCSACRRRARWWARAHGRRWTTWCIIPLHLKDPLETPIGF
jgi:hypothetical protein